MAQTVPPYTLSYMTLAEKHEAVWLRKISNAVFSIFQLQFWIVFNEFKDVVIFFCHCCNFIIFFTCIQFSAQLIIFEKLFHLCAFYVLRILINQTQLDDITLFFDFQVPSCQSKAWGVGEALLIGSWEKGGRIYSSNWTFPLYQCFKTMTCKQCSFKTNSPCSTDFVASAFIFTFVSHLLFKL